MSEPQDPSVTLPVNAMKKVIIAITSIVMIAWMGVGAYFLFFRGGTEGGTGAVAEHNEPKPEKKEDTKDAPQEEHKEKTPSAPMTSSAVITTVSEEDNWKLDTPIDDLNFNDPKDRDKARRKIARDIKVENRKALAVMKESTAEEKERKAQSAAIEAWLEKGTRQDAIP